jgi:DNA-binding MarR family transcriptional regulator
MPVKIRGSSHEVDFCWGTPPKRIRRSFRTKAEALVWEADAKARLVMGVSLEKRSPKATAEGGVTTLEAKKEATPPRHCKGTACESEVLRKAEEVIEILGVAPHPVATVAVDDRTASLKTKGNSNFDWKLAAPSKIMSTNRLLSALAVVRTVDPELPTQDLGAFLFISQNPGCPINALSEPLELAIPQASNIVSRLGEGWLTRKGLGLLRVDVDPADKRRRLLFLSPEGQRFLAKLEKSLT